MNGLIISSSVFKIFLEEKKMTDRAAEQSEQVRFMESWVSWPNWESECFGRQDGCRMNRFKNGYMGFTRIISDVKAFLEEDMVVGTMDGLGRKNLENKIFSFQLLRGWNFQDSFLEASMFCCFSDTLTANCSDRWSNFPVKEIRYASGSAIDKHAFYFLHWN